MSESTQKPGDGRVQEPAGAFFRATAEAWQSALRQAAQAASSAPWLSPDLPWNQWTRAWWPLGTGDGWPTPSEEATRFGVGPFGFPIPGFAPTGIPIPGVELFFQIGQWWASRLMEAAQQGPAALAQALSAEATEPLFGFWRQQLQQVSDLAARLPWGPLLAGPWGPLGLTGSSSDLLRRLFGPWQESLNDLLSAWQRTLRGDTDAFRHFVRTWKDTYDKTHGRLLQAPLLGYSREPAERFYRSLDAYVDYLAALQEFASVLERVGKVSLQRWTARLGEMTAGGAVPDHRDVYRLFVETFEASFLEVFRSREYSRLQGQMVEAGLRFKRHLDQALEDWMRWLPVPTRSEVRDLYAAFYDLRKEVRSLARRLAEQTEGSAPAEADRARSAKQPR